MISAVMPLSYNKERIYFGKNSEFINIDLTIDSLLYHDVISEIIISNYTSKYLYEDEQIDHIKRKYGKNKKVIIIDSREGRHRFNQSWLLNMGIRLSSQKYFMRNDADWIICPNFSDIFTKNVRSISSGKPLFLNGKGIPIHDKVSENEFNFDWNSFTYPDSYDKCKYYIESKISEEFSGSSIVCKMEDIKNIRGYEERYQIYGMQDLDLKHRLYNYNKKDPIIDGELIHQPHTSKKDLYYEREKNSRFIIWSLERLVYVKRKMIFLANEENKWGEKEPNILSEDEFTRMWKKFILFIKDKEVGSDEDGFYEFLSFMSYRTDISMVERKNGEGFFEYLSRNLPLAEEIEEKFYSSLSYPNA